VHRGGDEADARFNGGPLWRLLQGWPRALYRWNERRYEVSRMPYAGLQAVNLGVLLSTYAMSGGVGVLIALLPGGPAEAGFWVGMSLAGVASILALGYLLWGGLLEWLAKRRQFRAPSP
jgi:hypothetical protein